MKLTDKQAHILVTILQASLSMDVPGFCFTRADRIQLLSEILAQQDEGVKELKEDK